ncbi:MAG TPA: hypothetical protein VN426_05210 [Syntrophomonadaceae bacterium]|nr:hypothetical protein [Syntrophomonadaceae bacterium]
MGKKPEKDPEKALDQTDKVLNTGVTGFLTKTFLGKDFVDGQNEALALGKSAINLQKSQQNLQQNGLPATAEVVTIQDTGQLINFNPVVIMQLKVQPQFEAPFEATVQTMVSKIAVPKVGDTISIKYNPADRTQVVVV